MRAGGWRDALNWIEEGVWIGEEEVVMMEE